MTHRLQHAPETALILLALALVLVGLFSLLPIGRAASATDGSCASTEATSAAGGTRSFTLSASSAVIIQDGCSATGQGITEAESGQPVTFRCLEFPSPGITPGAADANGIHLRVYADSASFANGGAGTPLWEALRSSCATEWDTTFYCTSDGTKTGTPLFGTLRLFVRAVRTSAIAYDVNSEDAGALSKWGILRCNPRDVTLTDPAQPVKYVGGDTFTATATTNASAFNTGTTATLAATCGTFTATLGSVALAPTATSSSATIKGDPATTWPAPCTLGESVTLSRLSTVSGFTGQPYARWWPTEPAGLTLSADHLTLSRSTGKPLDRGLTASDCAASVAGPVQVVNRAESVTLAAHWSNARAEAVPSGRLVDAYPYRSGTTPDAETDYPHVSATAGSAGLVTILATSRVTGTTTQNTTAPDYAMWVKTYGASRTSAELYNLGGCAPFFDLSWVWTFNGLTLTKQQSPVQNASVFVIGADLMYARAEGLTEADGLRIAGESVTCQRTLPDATSEAAAILGTTDATGTTPLHQFLIVAPPGTWLLACWAADNGNYAFFAVTYTHASPLSAQTAVGIVAFATPDGYSVNVTAVLRSYDPACDCPARIFPDAGSSVRLTLLFWNNTTAAYDAGPFRWAMNQTSATESAFYAVANLSGYNLSRPVVVLVSANLTGRAFLSSSAYASLAPFVVQSAGEPTVIETTWPFFGIMAVGFAFCFAALQYRAPFLAVFTLPATFAGYALFQQARASGLHVLSGAWIPILLLAEGIASLGVAAYAMKK